MRENTIGGASLPGSIPGGGSGPTPENQREKAPTTEQHSVEIATEMPKRRRRRKVADPVAPGAQIPLVGGSGDSHDLRGEKVADPVAPGARASGDTHDLRGELLHGAEECIAGLSAPWPSCAIPACGKPVDAEGDLYCADHCAIFCDHPSCTTVLAEERRKEPPPRYCAAHQRCAREGCLEPRAMGSEYCRGHRLCAAAAAGAPSTGDIWQDLWDLIESEAARGALPSIPFAVALCRATHRLERKLAPAGMVLKLR